MNVLDYYIYHFHHTHGFIFVTQFTLFILDNQRISLLCTDSVLFVFCHQDFNKCFEIIKFEVGFELSILQTRVTVSDVNSERLTRVRFELLLLRPP